MCNTVEELKGAIDDDGSLDRYLDGMKGNNEDVETFENPIGDAGTEIIEKGLLYWENKSNSDSDEDNGNPISSYRHHRMFCWMEIVLILSLPIV